MAPVVDLHTHGPGFLPRPVAALYRVACRGHMPPDVDFDVLPRAGVDVAVAKAVGDWIVTRWWPGSAWSAVLRQLDAISAKSEAAAPSKVLLGVEGADALGADADTAIGRLDELHRRGVRVIGLVHFVDNPLGTVCMPWQDWMPGPLKRTKFGARTPGLTPLGADVMRRMAEHGMIVDLAHADRATTLQGCELAGELGIPVVSSHTGARALHDFARFHPDDELRAIAATGGLIGLWPFHFGGKGVRDIDDWARHAAYLADLVGTDHLCIGTDMNGVSGTMDGYETAEDFPKLVDALSERAGFAPDDVEAVTGANAARLLA